MKHALKLMCNPCSTPAFPAPHAPSTYALATAMPLPVTLNGRCLISCHTIHTHTHKHMMLCRAPGDNICVLLPRLDDETSYIDSNRQMCWQGPLGGFYIYIFSFWDKLTEINAAKMCYRVSCLLFFFALS